MAMGTRKFLTDLGVDCSSSSIPSGFKTVCLAFNGILAGGISLIEIIRNDAVETVCSIESTGCSCIMLSSSDLEPTKTVADAVGIKEFYYNCKPLDRLEKIQKIKEEYPVNSVFYLGNGRNDSSELSAADISVCTNGLYSEIAFQSGDIVVLGNMPGALADSIDSARIMKRTVRQLFLAAIIIKLFLLLLAILGIEYQLWFTMLADVVLGVAGTLLASRIR